MTDRIDIKILSSFSDKGITEAQKAVAALKAAMATATAPSSRSTAPDYARQTQSVLALQQAQARLEAQQGNLTGAAERLRNALSQQATTTTATIGAQRQLLQVEQQQTAVIQQAAAQQERAAASALQHAQTQARLQAASGNTAAAIRTLQQALQGIEGSSANAIRAETQLVQLQQRMVQQTAQNTASTRSYGQSFLALAGPLGVATTGIGALLAVAGRVKEGFELKASLDATTASINAQLKGVRDTSQVYAEAAQFGREFKLTQQELAAGISASIGVMRNSKAPVEDILSVLARLQVLSPEQSLQEAAFALKALAGGDTQSLVTRFEVSRDLATQMKNEIAAGGDAVQVVSRFLDNMGIGMDALKAKTEGASGATKDYAIAQENLSLALGRLAEGPGVQVLNFLSGLTNTLADLATKGDAFAGAASGADAIQTQLVGLAASYEDYGNRLAAVNQQVRDEIGKTDPVFAALVGSIQQLTPAQYDYAQSLIQTGTAQGEAVSQAQEMGEFFEHLSTIQEAASVSNQTTAASLAELTPQMAQVAAFGPEVAQGVLVMAAATATGKLDVENFRAALDGLITDHAATTAATTTTSGAITYQSQAMIDASAATQEYTNTLTASAAQSLIAETNSQNLARRKEELRAAAIAAAGGLGTTADQAAHLASQFNITEKEAYDLINALRQIPNSPIANVGKGLTSGLSNALPKVLERTIPATGVTGLIKDIDKVTDAMHRFNTTVENPAKPTRGRGGGVGRANVANQAGEQLTKIEQQTGDKLAAIDRATQDKLVALDQKAAEQRAQAAYKLASDIATSQADMLAEQEANDLDLIGAKEDQIGKLQAREQAEAKARQATLEAQRQAQEQAAAGDAETAQKVLDVRERSIAAQEKIDQQYYEKQQELAGDDAALAALKQQYDEATAANQAAADTRIMLAQQEAQQKAQAAQQERDQIIAAAEEQKAQVLGKAVEQAQGVSKASADQRAAVVANLNAQAEAIRAWAGSMESASARVVDSAEDAKAALAGIPGPAPAGAPPAGSGSTSAPTGSSSSGPAGGAQIARGGGAQISGRGTLGGTAAASSPADALASLQSLNQVLDQLLKLANQYGKYAAPLEKYKASIGVAIETLNATFELSQNLGSPAPPISMAAVQALLAEGQQIVALFLASLLPTTKQQVEAAERYRQLSEASIAPLKEMVDLRQSLGEPTPAFTRAMAEDLIADVVGAAYLLRNVALPTTEQQAADAERFQRASEATIAPFKEMVDLRQALAEPTPVFTKADAEDLIADVLGVTYLMRQVLLPTTEQQAEDAERFQRAAEATLAPFSAIVDLRQSLEKPLPVLTKADAEDLIADVVGVTYLMRSALLPTTEEQAAEAERWQRASEASIAPLSAVLDLRKGLAEPAPALDLAQIRALAGETVRVNQAVQGVLLPVTEEQSEGLQRWADATQASVTALKAPLDLSGKLFADYVSPSDAQLNLLAQDANRVASRMLQAASIYDTKGLEAGKAYAEGISATFGAFNEALVFIDRLRFSDLGIDPKSLALFEQSVGTALDTAGRLGALAATIPAGNITALNAVTSALGQSADTMIRLAAVPFGDLSSAIGNLGGGSGSNAPIINVNIYNPPANMDIPSLTRQIVPVIKQQLNTATQGRRS